MSRGRRLESPTIEGESPVPDTDLLSAADPQVRPGTRNLAGIWEDHLPRLNMSPRPIVNEYREGKVKSTPVRGVKEFLKPHAYKQSEDDLYGVILAVSDCVPFA